ncbi:MAG: helix-turn-helix domain-containing protein [Anaerolineae bacterium]|jgi:transcriptional regulator with XRE-family HTH domain|nr:helix-turn-helix domain-containing protein [Anaerolineae bacterium]
MSEGWGNVSALAAARLGKKGKEDKADKPFDFAESYRLRAKMLGVLIHDARMKAARTQEDCARLLRVEPSVIAAWEYGDDAPSLPQLELLAYYLDVPISHFWGQNTLTHDSHRDDAQSEYLSLRNRMVGALLRQAREERNLSLEDVAAASHLEVTLLQQYEMGELPIPMHELTVISGLVQRNLGYFLESTSYIGTLLQIREDWKQFNELSEEVRRFAANPLNLGFIEIAMLFGNMPAEKLRKVAEGLLQISM